MITDRTIAGNSLCVLLYCFSASLSARDHYAITLTVLSACFRRRREQTQTSRAFVLQVKCLLKFEGARIGKVTKASFSAFRAVSSTLLKDLNMARWSFHMR